MTQLRYLFYLGCTVPYRVSSYEISARKVLDKLDVELVEMPEFNCCGLPLDPINHEIMLLLSARNLCVAEREGLNILTLCTGCATTLRKVNKMLKQDKKLREHVNGFLKEIGMEFNGTIEVKHLIQMFMEDLGLEKIKEATKRPLHRLSVAEHYGCHALRPRKFMGYDDPEDPKVLKELIEITGARCLDYIYETECCGLTVIGIDEKISLQLTREKLNHVKMAGAQALITICPSCFLMYDVQQPRIERMFGENLGIPVLHYTEMLGLAMGLSPDELALKEHRVSTQKILDLL